MQPKKVKNNKKGIDTGAIEYWKYIETERKQKEERELSVDFYVELSNNPPDEVVKKLIDNAYVSQVAKSSDAEIILQIRQGTEYSNVLSLENISTVIGKAKSRKTMLTSLIISSLIGQNEEGGVFKATKHKKKRILVFDTEQSRGQAKVTYDRVKQILQKEKIENVSVFSLRSYTPYERLDAIEKLVEYFKDSLLMVVIDGVRDLIYDINNIIESTELVTRLLRLSEKYRIHILNVIHQNKTDNNPRGSIGTELLNKTEVVISVVKKDEMISEVKPYNSRNKTFDPFKFGVDITGTPYLMVFEKPKLKKEILTVFEPQKMDTVFHENLLKAVFIDESIEGYSVLKESIKKELMNLGYDIGYSAVVKLMSYYFKIGLINSNGKSRPRKYYL
jgi:hypothetical protein